MLVAHSGNLRKRLVIAVLVGIRLFRQMNDNVFESVRNVEFVVVIFAGITEQRDEELAEGRIVAEDF